MASLFTNASAQTALQTLTKASKSLSATQNRVSTGYRINTAEDNAAYWSIATTLRSDVGALGAVKDALGLGAATIDTVYTGINDTKDLLDQIKSKLVAASQTGVPRAQVQAEISQLQNRLADVSKSTVINSETWLTQDSSVEGYSSSKDIVGSFTRAGGVVTIENINIDIRDTKLYEKSTATQTAVTNSLDVSTAGTARAAYEAAFTPIDGLVNATETTWNTAVATIRTAVTTYGTAPLGAAPAAAGDVSAWAFTAINDAGLTTALAGFAGSFGGDGATFVASLTTGQRASLVTQINAAGATLQAAIRGVPSALNLTSDDVSAIGVAKGAYDAQIGTILNDVFTLTARDEVTAKVANDARKVYESAAKGDASNANLGIFDKVRTVVSNKDGTGAQAVRVSDIDISDLTDTAFDKGVLTSYLTAVDDALQELTLSASIVGAAKARIEGNKTFVQNLIDANNRGIGQLVDADLNEESSKLKALQVQEQLSIQALSIANNSTQNILSLFQ